MSSSVDRIRAKAEIIEAGIDELADAPPFGYPGEDGS